MTAPHFADQLACAVRRCGNPVLVGLDPRLDSLPAPLRPWAHAPSLEEIASAYGTFCRGVIDVVAPLVAAVKPQAAFFEDAGPAGMQALAEVVRHARERGLLVILDGKRSDIGSTAEAYASAYLGAESPWGADALTVSPYLGGDSLSPFVQVAAKRGAGVFVLVKTSNPDGGLFQDLQAPDKPLYERVAAYVEQLAESTRGPGGYGCVGAVVGATYPAQLAALRAAMPHAWFLVPGVGAQGATARDVAAAFDRHGLGAVVNSSRAIIFAHARKDFAGRFGDQRWQQAVEAAARQLIEELRAETPAGQLVAKEN
jgi:orotidine-5'-phosphate decarboxylase